MHNYIKNTLYNVKPENKSIKKLIWLKLLTQRELKEIFILQREYWFHHKLHPHLSGYLAFHTA